MQILKRHINIWHKQKVEGYGKTIFVAQYLNLPKHNVNDNKFPFESAKILNEEEIQKIAELSNNSYAIAENLRNKIKANYNKKNYVIYNKKLWIDYSSNKIKPYAENLNEDVAKDIVAKFKNMQDKNQIKEIVGRIVTKRLLEEFPISDDVKNEVFDTFNVEYVNMVNERLGMVILDLTQQDSE